MDFEKIRARLDKLVAEGRKGELRGALSMLNEVDIAEYMEELDNEKMLMVFRLLPKDIAADVFAYMDADQRQRVIEAMDDNEAVRLVDDMFIDDAVDFLEELPAGVVKRVLKGCDAQKRALINQFLRYPENSAGSIMTIEYMELHVGTTVGEAMAEIRRTGLDKETIYTLYVLDAQRKLLGTLPLRKLLLAQDDVKVETLMNQQFVCVHTTDDQELVADTVRKYDLISIPVVDHEERMIGIITIDDIVDVIEEENTEDFEKMAAMLPSEDEYLKTGVLTLAKNRMPWLLFLMISAIFTGMIITHYEDALKTSAFGVVLTACIPMLMGAGGNCGSQASTLTIRGLALGEVELKDIFKLLWKEVRVGLDRRRGALAGHVRALHLLARRYGRDHRPAHPHRPHHRRGGVHHRHRRQGHRLYAAAVGQGRPSGPRADGQPADHHYRGYLLAAGALLGGHGGSACLGDKV